MAMDFKETKELEELKQKHKVELLVLNRELAKEEHEMKMARLEKLLAIAQAGGKPNTEAD